ncbi:hypothetical protein I6N95_08640 [Vagococcus sp. BWB3-3]|uniref:Uncharacterized protein n=1 Tax=Vagococcus allomyrinae TaxID=2794353 RepID=A0A940SW69_9ENTE|nr:hypothetical protein [Vagococcus allomyrinae]MBP1041068.1 hypothetical protein [Vagococcus allomyrinae]
MMEENIYTKIEKLEAENDKLRLKREQRSVWTHWSWLCYPAMWVVYGLIHQLLLLLK